MDAAMQASIRDQLLDRRKRLQTALADVGPAADLVRLLQQVDGALKKVETPTFNTCEMCKETIEDDLLTTHPLMTWCLCRLSPEQLQVLQNDLDLAARIQLALLPKQDLVHSGWEMHFRYEPAGVVSGDTLDAVARQDADRSLFFMLGDVSGKGVAASLFMARLNALFRSLLEEPPPLPQLVERANRLFAENAISSHYATLVCGRASSSGGIEICNAGHCPPIVIRRGGEATTIGSTGFPVGIFARGPYDVHHVSLDPGDALFLYTDGLTEARDPGDREYGLDRLRSLLQERAGQPARALAAGVLRDLAAYLGGAPRTDDLTLMVVRRAA